MSDKFEGFSEEEFESIDNLEVVFAPGCFDTFEGTQEELDSLIEELKRLAMSGDLIKNSKPVDPNDPLDAKVIAMWKNQNKEPRREN